MLLKWNDFLFAAPHRGLVQIGGESLLDQVDVFAWLYEVNIKVNKVAASVDLPLKLFAIHKHRMQVAADVREQLVLPVGMLHEFLYAFKPFFVGTLRNDFIENVSLENLGQTFYDFLLSDKFSDLDEFDVLPVCKRPADLGDKFKILISEQRVIIVILLLLVSESELVVLRK
jgi:hypothetical protein